MKKLTVIALFSLLFFFVSAPAYAIIFGFQHIVEEGDGPSELSNGAIGESQLFMDVAQSNGQVLFTFFNTGPEASSITDIYFDDDTPLLAFSGTFFESSGVSYSEGASPGDLPGGNTVSFTADHSFDSNAPAQPNGVNPGEALGILFNFVGAIDFQDVLSALYSGDLMVGLHVQGFADGGSESFVQHSNSVPEPSTLLLLGASVLGLAGFSRKRFFR